MMFEPKRIHPVGMILSFISIIKSYIIPAIVFFIFGNNGNFHVYFVIGASCLFVVVVGMSFFEWWKFKYWVEEGELRIEHGVFVNKKRYIPIERIQSINSSAGIIQQIFGLVKVQVETAGGGIEAEAVLTAIKKSEAEQIQKAIAVYKQNSSKVDEDQPEEEKHTDMLPDDLPTYRMKMKDLFVAASTSSGIGVILSAFAAFLSQIDEIIPYERIFDHFDFLTHASFTLYAMLVFIAFLVAWILSIVGALLKYAYFTVSKDEHDLKISKGLFEKQQVTIPISRIQAIRIVQNPIRQLLGYVSIYIESASGSVGDEGSSTILFPVVSKKEITPLLKQYLPLYENSTDINKLPKRSKRRYLVRKMVPAAIICIPCAYFLAPWGYLSLALIFIAGYWGDRCYKDAGWKLVGDQLQLNYRVLSKTTVIIHRKRLQSIKSKTTYFQRKNALQTFEVWIKSGITGGRFTVKDIDRFDNEQLVEWYSYSKVEN